MLPVNIEYVAVAVLLAAYALMKWGRFEVYSRRYLIVVVCLLATLNLRAYRTQVDSQVVFRTDTVLPTERALLELRLALPREGYVGFISDEPIDSSNKALEKYFLTQYVLAPLVIEEGAARQFVIGSFENPGRAQIPPELNLVRDYGAGLMLFTTVVE